MQSARLTVWALVGAALAACAHERASVPAVSVAATAPPASGAVRVTAPVPGRAYYAPRVPWMPFGLDDSSVRRLQDHDDMWGPIRTNIPPRATADLGGLNLGIVAKGRRYLHDGAHTTLVTSQPHEPLRAVVQVPKALGGGFVFEAADRLYASATFDGALVPVGDAFADFVSGPRCIAVSARGSGKYGVYSLADGAPLTTAPALVGAWSHPKGFMVGMTADAAYFSADGCVWTRLAKKVVDRVMPDDDGFDLAFGTGETKHVGPRGALGPARSAGPNWPAALAAWAAAHAHVDESVRPAELFEHAWVPTGRTLGEWFTVSDEQLQLADLEAHTMRRVPLADRRVSSEVCGAVQVGGAPRLLCQTEGGPETVLRIDFSTGATTEEASLPTAVSVLPDMFPSTLMAASDCRSAQPAHVCVRGVDGAFHAFAAPPTAGAEDFIFPGEWIRRLWDAQGNLELFVNGARTGSFSASDLRDWTVLAEPPGAAPTVPAGLSALSYQGALRTGTSLRSFYRPSPHVVPRVEPLVSYALDLPLSGGSHRLVKVPGIVATAGAHGLRLDAGKLYETDDGWLTWADVEPPPTGVPDNLDGAMCDERGCLFGPWARIGWDRDAR